MESGSVEPDPCPGSRSIPSSFHTRLWGHGLLASPPRAWQRLVQGAGGCRKGTELPTAGPGLVWASMSCHRSGEKRAPACPLETPKFPRQDLQRVITHPRGYTSLFPAKSQFLRLGGGCASIPREGMQRSGKRCRAHSASLRGCRHAPIPTLPHCPTTLCPRAAQDRADVGLLADPQDHGLGDGRSSR